MKFVKNALTPPIAAISAAIFAVLTAQADVLEVGEGRAYTDIATAIGDAKDYDTVLVYDGTYVVTEQIAVTKAITVKSVNGAAVTEIKRTDRGDPLNMVAATDGPVVKRVVFIDNSEARVEGFAVSGGYVAKSTGDYGAGVCIGENGGWLVDCVVSNNLTRTVSYGGGVAMLGDKSVVSNCQIVANYGCMVGSAEGYGYGAGVYLAKGLLTHSSVCDNNKLNKAVEKSGRTGKGMHGAGVYMVGGRISHCRIVNNRMDAASSNVGAGGGVYMTAGSIDNSLVAGNGAAGYANIGDGGGIYAYGSNIAIANCTIVGNSAANKHGGLYLSNGKISVANTVIANNTAVNASPEWGGNATAVFSNCLCTVALTSKSVKPQVVDDAKLDAEYHPTSSSACVDNGWDDVLGGTVVDDLAGQARYDGAAIDIGCFEFQVPKFKAEIAQSADKWTEGGTVTFVAKVQTLMTGEKTYRWRFDGGEWSAYDTADSTSLTSTAGDHTVELQVRIGDAEQEPVPDVFYLAPLDIYVAKAGGDYTDVRMGLERARKGTTVHVAPGVYELEGEQLTVGEGIVLVGDQGAAKTEIRRVDAEIFTNPVDPEDPPVAKRVILVEGKGAVVKGLTVSGGYQSKIDYSFGAGVCITSPDGQLLDCYVTNNVSRVTSYGAGVSMQGENAVVSNCVIAFNSPIRISNADGDTLSGGIYMMNGLLVDSVVLSNNFPRADILMATGRKASGNDVSGAGVYSLGGVISRCRIEGNYTSGSNRRDGAGLYASGGVSVDNCLIAGNVNESQGTGGSGGGASIGGVTLLNCTIVSNRSVRAGGVAARDILAKAVNCIIQDNAETVGEGSDDFSKKTDSDVFLTDLNVSFSLTPQVPVVGGDNIPGRATFSDADFHLAADSLGLRKGTVVGYESRLLGGIDLDGMPRTVTRKKLIDMGCYQREYRPGLMLLVR